MAEYRAPLEDMRFVLEHIADLAGLAKLPGFEDAEPEVVSELLEEAGRFMGEVMSPLNAVGDTAGARLTDEGVRTPPGFPEAYAQFAEAGWNAVGLPSDYGGGGLPYLIAVVVQEMLASANMAMGLCPALSEGAIEALYHHGTEGLKDAYLSRLVTGEWTATMDLTEPQAGSDLGALRSQAVRNDDGSYRISGTKIFITFGDHDMAENVIHLVLARTPDAPAGSRGISLFIVPKFLVNPDGSPGPRNDVKVVSLEHKIGIHASPTCVMSYGEEEGAVGYLIGEENNGLRYMFTMMNRERIFVATQGLGIAERAYQRAVDYARERRQGRAIGHESSDGEASPIVDHADVRRMLMTMRSRIEAMRCLLYVTAAGVDRSNAHPDAAERAAATARTALLTPVAKAWLTDRGVELTSTGIQVHGGMGYVEETGAAQYWRDSRIAPIYEGTNGIQATDLVLRKLPMDDGAVVRAYIEELAGIDGELAEAGGNLAHLREPFSVALDALRQATEFALGAVKTDPPAAAASAVPYLDLFGAVAGGVYLARSACVAQRLAGNDPDEFLTAKVASARFYAEQLLPEAAALLPAVRAGAAPLYAIDTEQL